MTKCLNLIIYRGYYGREINESELNELLELYLNLHEDSIPEMTENLKETWNIIINDINHHIIVNEIDNKIVSSCVCVIIPNLTRGVRPYAFIENVVTHSDYRGYGYATECLEYAKYIAEHDNCYKMMLLTGSKKGSILRVLVVRFLLHYQFLCILLKSWMALCFR